MTIFGAGSACEIAFLTEVTDQDGREVRVAAGGEDRDAVADRPEHEARQPLLQAEADCGGHACR